MKIVKPIACAIFLFAAFLVAGTSDRTNAVIYNMPECAYKEIRDTLTIHGERPSEKQIADYYLTKYKNNHGRKY